MRGLLGKEAALRRTVRAASSRVLWESAQRRFSFEAQAVRQHFDIAQHKLADYEGRRTSAGQAELC